MRLNVTSEIGKLKSVLVHLPGREIDVMVPPMMTQLLFDDILYGQVAREEHRRFQQLLRFVAQNVYDIQDLLEEILEDDDVKLEVLRDLGERNKFGRKLQARLREEPAAGLAEVLIGNFAITNFASISWPAVIASGPSREETCWWRAAIS